MSAAQARLELSNLRDYLRSSLEDDRDKATSLDLIADQCDLPAWRRELYADVALKHRVKADRKERQADALDIALGYMPKFQTEEV